MDTPRHTLPDEVIFYEEEAHELAVLAAPKKLSRRAIDGAIGAVIGVASLTAHHNIQQNSEYFGLLTENEETGVLVNGCEDYTLPETTGLVAVHATDPETGDSTVQMMPQDEANTQQEESVADVESVANKNDTEAFNPFEARNDLYELMEHQQARFELADTGIIIEVYSDRPDAIEVDEEAFSYLALASLVHTEYTHEVLRQNAHCMHERVIENREFAGEVLRVPLPSDFRMTFIDGMVQQAPMSDRPPETTEEWAAYYRARREAHAKTGFTPPEVYAGLPFNIWEWHRNGYYLSLAPGSPDAEQAERKIARKLTHEFSHFWYSVTETQQDINNMERTIQLGDRDTLREVFGGSIAQRPITYTER